MTPIFNTETEYLDLLYCLKEEAKLSSPREDRTKVGCYSMFGVNFNHNLSTGFPLFTTKKVFWRGIVEELLWFLRGETNISSLKEKKVNIWNEWALPNGDVGPMYGKLWRNWDFDGTKVDQLANLITEIQTNPNSRRLVMSTWNPPVLPNPKIPPQENVRLGNQCLAPCHGLVTQFFVKKGKLSLQTYQRSADLLLGYPFNIASYSLLAHIIANICDLEVGNIYYTLGDAHIYSNHLEAIETQLSREQYDFPQIKINRKLTLKDLDVNNFTITTNDFSLLNYNSHPSIKAEVAI